MTEGFAPGTIEVIEHNRFLYFPFLACLYISLWFGRSEFIFINPNSKGQCGCGESFMTTGSTGATKQSST